MLLHRNRAIAFPEDLCVGRCKHLTTPLCLPVWWYPNIHYKLFQKLCVKISEIMLSKERSMRVSTSFSLLEGQTWWRELEQPYWVRRRHPELRMAERADRGSLCPWHCAATTHSQSCPSKLWEKINIYPVWASAFRYQSLTRFQSTIHVRSKI